MYFKRWSTAFLMPLNLVALRQDLLLGYDFITTEFKAC